MSTPRFADDTTLADATSALRERGLRAHLALHHDEYGLPVYSVTITHAGLPLAARSGRSVASALNLAFNTVASS
jgi:hypothetical protein